MSLGLCWSCSGMTLRPESGILSRPASPLASLPPDVNVPLPLRLVPAELPVVVSEFGDDDGFAELAAGSPTTEPRPLGPPCACAMLPESRDSVNNTIVADFMRRLSIAVESNRLFSTGFQKWHAVPVADADPRREARTVRNDLGYRSLTALIRQGAHHGTIRKENRDSGHGRL